MTKTASAAILNSNKTAKIAFYNLLKFMIGMVVSHQHFFAHAVLVMYEHVYEVSSLSNFRKLALRWAALGSGRQR